MFHNNKRPAISLKDARAKLKSERVMRLLSPHQLLISEKIQDVIGDFEQLMGLDGLKYERHCLKLINTMAAYLQELPASRNSYFSMPCGFMLHGLSRCQSALKACRAYFVNDKGRPADVLSEPQQLWMYCLFSAALLRAVGLLYIDLKVTLYDGSGRSLGLWNPLANAMTESGAVFYEYDYDEPHHETYRKRVTVSLATRMMPSEGLRWLADNKEVYEVWLALLEDDIRVAGTLGILLDKADAAVINKYFLEMLDEELLEGDELEELLNTDGDKDEKKSDKSKRSLKDGQLPQTGIEFIKWLTKCLGTAQLMINKPPLFSVPGGLLMSPDVFKLFIREHPQYKNWQHVQQAFLQLQMHGIGLDGDVVQRFTQDKGNRNHTGVVLGAVNVVLPEKFSMVNLANGVESRISRQAFSEQSKVTNTMKLQTNASLEAQYITQSGQWRDISPSAPVDPLLAKSKG